MKKTLLALGLLTSAAIAVGCDDDGGGGGDGGAGTGGGAVTDAAATDGPVGTGGAGGAVGGAGGSSGGAGGTAAVKTGNVTVSTTITTVGATTIGTYSASAAFTTEGGLGGGSTNCTTKTVAGCSVTTCQSADGGVSPSPTADGGVATPGNVGRIDITGGADPIALTPSADGSYAPATGLKPLWTAATELTFKSAGGTIPAFPETKVTTPALATMLKLNDANPPTFPNKATVMRGAGLKVGWTGGSGDLNVILGQSAGGKSVSALCSAPTAPGMVTLAPALLNELSPGDATLLLSQSASKTVMAGDYRVTLSAATAPTPALVALDVQ